MYEFKVFENVFTPKMFVNIKQSNKQKLLATLLKKRNILKT